MLVIRPLMAKWGPRRGRQRLEKAPPPAATGGLLETSSENSGKHQEWDTDVAAAVYGVIADDQAVPESPHPK